MKSTRQTLLEMQKTLLGLSPLIRGAAANLEMDTYGKFKYLAAILTTLSEPNHCRISYGKTPQQAIKSIKDQLKELNK